MKSFHFFIQDGYLFFSSDGRGGKGGLDLFATSFAEDKTFKGLQHLSAPFNSNKDDLGLIVSADGMSGYFGSDRKPTKGKDDLYRWTSPISIFCFTKMKPLKVKELLVTNELGESVDKAYVWLIPMNQDGPALHKEHFTTELVPNGDKEGTFFLHWTLLDTLPGASANSISTGEGRSQLSADDKLNYAIVVQHEGYVPFIKVVTGKDIPAKIKLTHEPEVSRKCLNTVFTVFNSSGSTPLSGANIMLSGPCIKVNLNVYTDPEGYIEACIPTGCLVKAEIQKPGYAMHTFTFTPSEEDEKWTVYLKDAAGLTLPAAPIAIGNRHCA